MTKAKYRAGQEDRFLQNRLYFILSMVLPAQECLHFLTDIVRIDSPARGTGLARELSMTLTSGRGMYAAQARGLPRNL
jgi:hypothetical protein